MSNHVDTSVTASAFRRGMRIHHPELGRCIVIALAPRARDNDPVAVTLLQLAGSRRHQRRFRPTDRFEVV